MGNDASWRPTAVDANSQSESRAASEGRQRSLRQHMRGRDTWDWTLPGPFPCLPTNPDRTMTTHHQFHNYHEFKAASTQNQRFPNLGDTGHAHDFWAQGYRSASTW